MRKLVATSAVLGLLLGAFAAAPVSAGTRMDVTITATTILSQDPNGFTSSIPGCAAGSVYSGGKVVFPRPHGNFVGYKLFDCGNDTGFRVRLNAQFFYDGSGSVGTWAIVDAWGSLAGMSGAGKLTGDAINNGIIDNYFGTVTL